MSDRDSIPAEAAGERRMTLAEHLDELRGCIVRSLLALVVACALCAYPAKFLLAILVRPLIMALRANGQPDSLLATSPVENIVVYIKVVLIFGLILAGPVVIYQLWSFIAAGLYSHEKKWVYQLMPFSMGLFVVGVVFMYVFALLVALNFLIGFSSWLTLPEARPGPLERTLIGVQEAPSGPTTRPDFTLWPEVPLVVEDPGEPPPGKTWFNIFEHRLKVSVPMGEDVRVYSYQFQRDDRRAMVTTHFKIGEYLNFVLILTIAFGLAFQMPLIVLFLARTGIVPVDTFRRYRKVTILIIVVIAGMLAPPDLLSHVMLSLPMYGLFELGLWLAARQERQARARRAARK